MPRSTMMRRPPAPSSCQGASIPRRTSLRIASRACRRAVSRQWSSSSGSWSSASVASLARRRSRLRCRRACHAPARGAPSGGSDDVTRSDVDVDVAVGPKEASGRASASIAARRGAGGCDAGMRLGVVGAERQREDWRAARDSFESRRSGSHLLKSLDELTPRAHLRAGRAVSHTLFPARRYVGRPSRRRLAPRVDGSSRFARARKFDREPSRVFHFRRPSSSRGVAR